MNKKILTKTLLPISVVALLGGGIASSLILSSCSKDKTIVLKSNEEIIQYLQDNAQTCLESQNTFLYDSYSHALSSPVDFFNFIKTYYTKQAYINGFIFSYALNAKEEVTSVTVKDNFIKITMEDDDEIFHLSIKFLKWTALNDCAIYVDGGSGSGYTSEWKINPDVSNVNYDTEVDFVDEYSTPNVNFDMEWETDNEFLFSTSVFDFTNIIYQQVSAH